MMYFAISKLTKHLNHPTNLNTQTTQLLKITQAPQNT
jgi:hypothetical protein